MAVDRERAPQRPDLDAWLANAAVRTHHRRHAIAPAAVLWREAQAVRLRDARSLGRLVRWRIPDVDPDQTFHRLLSDDPFVVLDAGPTWSLSGLCGRIWTLQRDYPRLADAAAFRAWDERGTVRVLFAHWVEPTDDGSTIVSETRVAPVDRSAARRLRSLWLVMGMFERLIGAEALTDAVRRAQRAR